MKNMILKIITISISILLIYCIKSYAVESGTVRMQINGGKAWTNIDVSQSYAECESLNSPTSTLGTSALKAHLTTDMDWSAMAIFSVSQYGGATINKPAQTTGNTSGIYDTGKNMTQTTGILNTAVKNSTIYISGLFNEDGSVKKYVKQWPNPREATNFVGFNETYGWLGADKFFSNDRGRPLSVKVGLFGVYCGLGSGYSSHVSTGGPNVDVTFRPVIWN